MMGRRGESDASEERESMSTKALIGMALCLTTVVPAGAACVVNQVAQLPITMDGLRPMLDVKMNGRDERLLLDTGAFYSTISHAVAASLGVKERDAKGIEIGGVGGSFVAKAGYVKSISFGRVTMANVGFLIGGSETGAAGLIGQDLLHGYDVDYDLAQGAVRLLRPAGCAGQGLAYWASNGAATIELNPTTQLQPHAVGPVTINGTRFRALFDTGASTTILSQGAAARLGVRPGGANVVEAGYVGGIGRGYGKSWIAPFTSFQIGQEEIKRIRLRFGDIALEGADMLIGADFFLSHHVLVSNSQNRLYFTYNGGPVFDLSRYDDAGDKIGGTAPAVAAKAAPAAPLPPLSTAGDYSRRAAVSAARRDWTAALADADQAVAKDPGNADYLVQRADLLRALKRDRPALTDLDAALKSRPGDARTLIRRADLHLDLHDQAAAKADLDGATAALPEQADLRLSVAALYQRADAFVPAIVQYGVWLKSHAADNKKADALNGRCWSRALAGVELAAALADCNAALYLSPKSADILDSRGLVRLRQGDLDRALVDYDAALAVQPKLAWSLYGRGLIARRRGDKAKGDADIAAALKVDAEVEPRAKRYGLDK